MKARTKALMPLYGAVASAMLFGMTGVAPGSQAQGYGTSALSAALVVPTAISGVPSASNFPQTLHIDLLPGSPEPNCGVRVIACTYGWGYSDGLNEAKESCQKHHKSTGKYTDAYMSGYNKGFSKTCGYMPYPRYS